MLHVFCLMFEICSLSASLMVVLLLMQCRVGGRKAIVQQRQQHGCNLWGRTAAQQLMQVRVTHCVFMTALL
jgi:hypothetical protein